jgi:hypothetical protein
MPKDEFDFGDPMELNGVGIVCAEDTTEAMTECFVEEFMRLGYNHKQILALFRNPHYIGMNMALQHRGEPFVRDKISEVFARRGQPVVWATTCGSRREEAQTSPPCPGTEDDPSLLTSAATIKIASTATDPMGAAIPDVTL